MQETTPSRNTALGGILLIAAGCFFLLQNMGWFGDLSNLIWSGLLGIGALVFLYVFFSRPRAQWWAAIPGFTLLGLATIVFIDNFGPAFFQSLTGSIFMGSIAVGFVMVYLVDQSMWWALIPAGALTTIALTAGLEDVDGLDSGGVFFMGLGLTFLVLGLLTQRTAEPQAWAFIPAAILLAFGVLIGTNFSSFGLLWPFVLIAGGGYLIWRNRREARP